MFKNNNDCKLKLKVPTEVNIFNCDNLIYIKPQKMKKRLEIYYDEKSVQETDLNLLINRFRQLKISKLFKLTGKKDASNDIPAAEDDDLKKIIKSVNKNINKLNKLYPSTSILDQQTKHKFKSISKATSLPLKKRLSELHNISSKKHKNEKLKSKNLKPKLPFIKQEPIFHETTNTVKTESQCNNKRTKLVKLIQRNLNNDSYKIIDKSSESNKNNKHNEAHASKKNKGSQEKLKLKIERNTKPIVIKKENSRLTRYQTKNSDQSSLNLNSKSKPYESKIKTIDPSAGSYKKIKSNIYVDIKPFTAYENQACSCKRPTNLEDMGCQENCLNRMMYVECDPDTCPCGDRCDNQRMQKQKWRPSGLQLFSTPDRGYGVRTTKPLKSGDFITEYTGEVVSVKEFERRESEDYHGSQHHYCLYIDRRAVIDAYRSGSICRFVNHSCAPNCVMQKWSVKGLPRIALYAKPQNSQGIISAGTELTYDYNFRCFQGRTAQPCLCGSGPGICRGYITTTSNQNGNGHSGSNSNGRNTPNSQEDVSPVTGITKDKASKKSARPEKGKNTTRSHKKKESPAVVSLKADINTKTGKVRPKTKVYVHNKGVVLKDGKAGLVNVKPKSRDVRFLGCNKNVKKTVSGRADKTTIKQEMHGDPVVHQPSSTNSQSTRALRSRMNDSKPIAPSKVQSSGKRPVAPLKSGSSKRKRLSDKGAAHPVKAQSHKKKDVKGQIVMLATLAEPTSATKAKKCKVSGKGGLPLTEETTSSSKEFKMFLPPAKRLRKRGFVRGAEDSYTVRKRGMLITSTPEMVEALRRLCNFYLDKSSPYCVFARALTLTSAASSFTEPHQTPLGAFGLPCYLKRNLVRAVKSFRALAVLDERLQALSSLPVGPDEGLGSRTSTPTSTIGNRDASQEGPMDAKPVSPVILLAEIFYLVKNYKNNRLKGWKYVSSPFYQPLKRHDSDRTTFLDTPTQDSDRKEECPRAATCFRDIERRLKSDPGYESFTAFDSDFEAMFSALKSALVGNGAGPSRLLACKYTLALRQLRQRYAVIVNSRIHGLRRTFPRDTIPIKCLLPVLDQSTSLNGEDSDTLPPKSKTPDYKDHTLTPSHISNDNSCAASMFPPEVGANKGENRGDVVPPAPEDDIINCPCRMFREEGTMIQCDKCLTWQHCECVTFPEDRIGPTENLPQNRSHYVCPACDGTQAPLDVPLCTAIVRDYDNDQVTNVIANTFNTLDRSTELTYYRTMGNADGNFRIKCGECYYVIRSQDSAQPEESQSSIREHADGNHRYRENLDIMRVIYLFADRNGQRWAQGHHFFRPGETFHEPSRRFFVNELLQVYVYETVPLDSIHGPCWVLDYGTYCKGRPWVEKINLTPSHSLPLREVRYPTEALPVEGAVPPLPDMVLPPEDDVYVCQFKVDKMAKAFTKINKLKYAPELTNYAFYAFGNALKPKRIYFPHEIPRKYASSDPSLWYMGTEALESVKKVLAGAPKSAKKSGNHTNEQTPAVTTNNSDHAALDASLVSTSLTLSSCAIDAIRETLPAFVQVCNIKRSAKLKLGVSANNDHKNLRGANSLKQLLSRLSSPANTIPDPSRDS